MSPMPSISWHASSGFLDARDGIRQVDPAGATRWLYELVDGELPELIFLS